MSEFNPKTSISEAKFLNYSKFEGYTSLISKISMLDDSKPFKMKR